MIRHVVPWRLKPEGLDRFHAIEQALHGQLERIPGLLRVEVGRSFAEGRRAVDLALVCDFESRDALASYHRHPAHRATRALVDPLVDHWITDYQIVR